MATYNGIELPPLPVEEPQNPMKKVPYLMIQPERRLIDAYKLEALVSSSSARYHHMDDIIAAIAKQPAVDAVEVVRCKDCMWARPKDHREPTDTPREFICQCAKHHHIPAPWGARMAVKADDFCSYGERKDNG